MSSIEDFFASLQNEKEKIQSEMDEANGSVKELLSFLPSNKLFKDYGTFYRLLYNVQNTVTPLIQRLLSFEMAIRRIEAQTTVEQQQEEKPQEEQQKKEGLKAKITSIIKVGRRKPQTLKPQEKREQLIEYGKNIVKRLDTVWDEYRARYYLIMFQDTEEEREREQYSNLEFISYVSNVCADIITFIDAAYQMRIQEIEARYENMVKALTVAESQQPLPSR